MISYSFFGFPHESWCPLSFFSQKMLKENDYLYAWWPRKRMIGIIMNLEYIKLCWRWCRPLNNISRLETKMSGWHGLASKIYILCGVFQRKGRKPSSIFFPPWYVCLFTVLVHENEYSKSIKSQNIRQAHGIWNWSVPFTYL